MRALLAWSLLAAALAGQAPELPPLRGAAMLSGPASSGALWGLGVPEAAARLGAPAAKPSDALAPTWFLARTFSRLWSVPLEGEDRSPGFSLAEVGPQCWLLARGGRVLGYLQKVPINDWDSYEAPARVRFGQPSRIHFPVARPAAGADSTDFMHMYRWRDSRTQFYILKKAPRSDTHLWRDDRTGAEMRLRTMQRMGGDVPLYVAAFSREDVEALRRAAPRRDRALDGPPRMP